MILGKSHVTARFFRFLQDGGKWKNPKTQDLRPGNKALGPTSGRARDQCRREHGYTEDEIHQENPFRILGGFIQP